MIKLYKAGSVGANHKNIETMGGGNGKLPINASSGNLIYCRSAEAGEVWPTVYEKAFAKWITNNNSDNPDITKANSGNCIKAIRQLTNQHKVEWKRNRNESPLDLWWFVRRNSISRKTAHPMVAWTYSSAASAPSSISYSDSNLVANHAYSALGWFYQNAKRYIVLRNP